MEYKAKIKTPLIIMLSRNYIHLVNKIISPHPLVAFPLISPDWAPFF